jgi:hypothetical protein
VFPGREVGKVKITFTRCARMMGHWRLLHKEGDAGKLERVGNWT